MNSEGPLICRYFHQKLLLSVSPLLPPLDSSASAIPEKARATPPLPPLPQSATQHEDSEDEDLYDDPLPLNE